MAYYRSRACDELRSLTSHMDPGYICQKALILVLLLSAPVIITSLFIGLIVSIFQAATQIQDQSLSFVPKLIVVGLVLMISGPWMAGLIVKFSAQLISSIATIR